MSKKSDLLEGIKIGEILNTEDEKDKKYNLWVIIIAVIGIIAVVAIIAYTYKPSVLYFLFNIIIAK